MGPVLSSSSDLGLGLGLKPLAPWFSRLWTQTVTPPALLGLQLAGGRWWASHPAQSHKPFSIINLSSIYLSIDIGDVDTDMDIDITY